MSPQFTDNFRRETELLDWRCKFSEKPNIELKAKFRSLTSFNCVAFEDFE